MVSTTHPRLPPGDSLAQIRLRSEEDSLSGLLADGSFRQLVDAVLEHHHPASQRMQLLGQFLRVTRTNAPQLFGLIDDVLAIAQISPARVEAFVQRSSELNAHCVSMGRADQLCVLLTSEIVEDLDPPQLRFVIGHELGHYAYQHDRIPVAFFRDNREQMSPSQALAVMSWARRAEISADRVGLLCSQDFEAAAWTLLTLASGLHAPLIELEPAVNEFKDQLRDITQPNAPNDLHPEWFASHPFAPLRVGSLELFWRSDLLRGLLGMDGATVDAAELAQGIERALHVMEPNAVAASPGDDGLRQCLVWGSYWVAACDGDVAVSEREKIASLLSAPEMADVERYLADCGTHRQQLETIRQQFGAAAGSAAAEQPRAKKLLVQKLVAVAAADEAFRREEHRALKAICEVLGLDPTLVDRLAQVFL